MTKNCRNLLIGVMICCLPAGGSPTNATRFAALDKSLADATGLLTEPAVSKSEARIVARKLQNHVDDISLDLNTRLPGGYGKPSPESEEYLSELGKVIEPYEKGMIELAFRTRHSAGDPLAGVGAELFGLLDFAVPDAGLDEGLRDALTEYPRARSDIYRKLFEHRLLTTADVDQIERQGKGLEDGREKMRWAEELAFYGRKAGLGVMEGILKIPFDPEGVVGATGEFGTNESLANYGPAAKVISFLGEKARSLHPLVKEREKEMRDALIPIMGEEKAYPFLAGWKQMEMYLTGELAPVVVYARNGSGPLALKQADLSPPREREGAPGGTGQKIKNEAHPLTANVEAEPKSRLFLHSCIILGLVAVGLISALLIRRNRRKERRKLLSNSGAGPGVEPAGT